MTDVCLHHSGIETELKSLCAKMDLRFDALDKALATAKSEMERRLEGMNEFRRQLDGQANTFATKTELRAEVEKLDLKITPILQCLATSEGSRRWTDYLIMAGISATIVLLSRLIIG